MTDTLIDCPFCGGKHMDIVVVHNDYVPKDGDDNWRTMYEIVCQGCSVTTSRYESEAEVIESWNTRAEPNQREIPGNEELLALRWKDWNQTIFLDRQYYRARTYRHILDNLAMEVNFHGDESTAAIVASARALMATVEKDAIAYADKKYKDEGRVKPTEAPKRESVTQPSKLTQKYELLFSECPKCGNRLIRNSQGIECGELHCDYKADSISQPILGVKK